MSDGKTFGQAVREARLAKGMSMGQLATSVERSTASVRRWERDEGMPAPAVMQNLLTVLGLDESEYSAANLPASSAAAVSPPSLGVSDSMRATSIAASSSAAPTDHSPGSSSGRMDRFLDPDGPWLKYARAGLTIVTLLLLAWLLIWALGGLVDAVGSIWQSLWSGSS